MIVSDGINKLDHFSARLQMANDVNNIAQELFKLLTTAASSRRGTSTSSEKKTRVVSKEEKEYRAQLKKQTEAYKAENTARRDRLMREKVVGKQYEDLIKKVEAFGTSVTDAAERAKNLKQLDKIPETVAKVMAASSSSFVKQMAIQAKTLEGVFKIENIAKARQDLINYLSTISGRNKISAEDYHLLETRVKAAGTSFEELGISAKKWQKKDGVIAGAYMNYSNVAMEQLIKDTTDLAYTLGDTSKLINTGVNKALTSMSTKAQDLIVKWGSWATFLSAARGYIGDFEKQRQYGATDASTINSSLLGVSLGQWTDQLVESRMTLLAMGKDGSDAIDQLRDSISSIREISGSPEQALKDLLGVQKNISKFGVAQQDLTGEVEKQVGIYNQNFRSMGYSVEQFNELTNGIVNDIDTRKILAGLQQKERKATIESLQARYAEIQAIYGAERAMEIFKKERSDRNMGPMERLQQSGKAVGVFAAAGLTKEGFEYSKLLKQQVFAKGDELTKVNNRLTELKGIFADRYEQLRTTNNPYAQGQVLSVQRAAEVNSPEMLNWISESKAGTEGSSIDLKNTKAPEMTTGQKIFSDLSSGYHQIENILSSNTVKMGLSAAAIGVMTFKKGRTEKLLEEIRDILKGKGGVLGNKSSWKDTLKDMINPKSASKLGKLLKIGTSVAGFATAGFEAYRAINSNDSLAKKNQALGGATGTVLGTEIGAAVGTLAGPLGAVVGGAIGGYAGKALGDFAGEHLTPMLDKLDKNIVTPSQNQDSAIMVAQQSQQSTLKYLNDLLNQQMVAYKIQEENHQISHEQAEKQLNVTRELIKTTKAGWTNNKEAIEKQTTDILKDNMKSVTMPVKRGTGNIGNPPKK